MENPFFGKRFLAGRSGCLSWHETLWQVQEDEPCSLVDLVTEFPVHHQHPSVSSHIQLLIIPVSMHDLDVEVDIRAASRVVYCTD